MNDMTNEQKRFRDWLRKTYGIISEVFPNTQVEEIAIQYAAHCIEQKLNKQSITSEELYDLFQAACASGAVDTVAEGRECRQSVMCDVWNATGYCSCCGGITLRGISDEGQP